VTPSQSQKVVLRQDERSESITLKVHGDKANVFCFKRNRCGALPFPGLGARIIYFKNYCVFEAIQPPRAAIQSRAQDDQLLGRPGGAEGTVQNHRAELIEQTHGKLPERIRRSAGAA